MNPRNDGVFASYNARFLTPQQVADSFIPSQNYEELLDSQHCLVLGPRGSGKTSLLKMLQVEALRAWRHSRAGELRARIGFTGAFVPTDIIWLEQISAIEELFGDPILSEAVSATLISSSILNSLLESFDSRLVSEGECQKFRSAVVDSSAKRELFSEIAQLWELGVESPTSRGLRFAMAKRIDSIRRVINEGRIKKEKSAVAAHLVDNQLLLSDGIWLAGQTAKLFNLTLDEPHGKWALCFDEIELAPFHFQRSIYRMLRSTAEELVFKVSASPFSADDPSQGIDGTQAAEGDDFRVIALWYSEKEDSDSFSRELAMSLLNSHGITVEKPSDAFGNSILGSSTGHLSAFEIQRRYSQFKSLSEKDPSFRQYLKDNEIVIERIPKMREPERASLVRKIYPVVVHRNFYLKEQNPKQRIASIKSNTLYTGWQAIQSACEGNPRMIIGIVSEMIRRCPSGSRKIPRGIQWDALAAARQRFEAKIKIFKVTKKGFDKGLMKLIDVLGECFQDELLGRQFKGEPAASFVVDESSFDWLGEAVGLGVNAGAFVYIPKEKGKTRMGSPSDKRFRINYLLATKYGIPLRIGGDRRIRFLIGRKDLEEQLLIPFKDNENFTK